MAVRWSGRDVIKSRTLGPTNTLRTRVRVSGWNRFGIYPWDHRLDARGNHLEAVRLFLQSARIEGEFVGGYDGRDHVWVLVG